MRLTFDTNIFITALFNEEYKIAVNSLINKQNSFLPLTLNNEIRDRLLKTHTLLIKIIYNRGENKKKFDSYLDEPDLITLKDEFLNLYEFLRDLKEDSEIEEKVEIMADITTSILMELGKITIYPPQDSEVSSILIRLNGKFNLLKRNIDNTQDIKHLILAEAYAQIFADDATYFISNDYVDLINNKEYIETVLNYVKVFDFESSPVILI